MKAAPTLAVTAVLLSTQRKPVAKMEAIPTPRRAVPQYRASGTIHVAILNSICQHYLSGWPNGWASTHV